MKILFEPKYNLGQKVYIPTHGYEGVVFEGNIHMIKFELHPYGESIHYDVVVSYHPILDDNYLANISESEVYRTYEEAYKNSI